MVGLWSGGFLLLVGCAHRQGFCMYGGVEMEFADQLV